MNHKQKLGYMALGAVILAIGITDRAGKLKWSMPSVSWIIICVLAGCGPPMYLESEVINAMENSKGHHISEIIKSIGPPTQITTDAIDGRIYIWSPNSFVPPGNMTETTKRGDKTTYTPTTAILRGETIMFWANENGIIYHWKIQGFDNIKPKEEQVAEVVFVLGLLALIACVVLALG